MLATCTMTTVPERDSGSSDARSFCRARIGGYSYPWLPAMSARTGPGRAPVMVVTGISAPGTEIRRDSTTAISYRLWDASSDCCLALGQQLPEDGAVAPVLV